VDYSVKLETGESVARETLDDSFWLVDGSQIWGDGWRKERASREKVDIHCHFAPSLLDMSEFVSSLPGGWTNILPLSHSLSIGDEPSLCCACPRICS